jgi:hypothetical protein
LLIKELVLSGKLTEYCVDFSSPFTCACNLRSCWPLCEISGRKTSSRPSRSYVLYSIIYISLNVWIAKK